MFNVHQIAWYSRSCRNIFSNVEILLCKSLSIPFVLLWRIPDHTGIGRENVNGMVTVRTVTRAAKAFANAIPSSIASFDNSTHR